MSSTLSHSSIAEICTLVEELQEAADLPNKEWRFIVDNWVAPDSAHDSPRPPAEYYSSDGFRITVGKLTLCQALDIVFSPGEPLQLWNTAPEGFIEGMLEVQLFRPIETVPFIFIRWNGTHVSEPLSC